MSALSLAVDPHPLLALGAFTTEFVEPLGQAPSPGWLVEMLALELDGRLAPVERSEDVRSAGRRLLRQGGYKPTGRGKPSSEYLVRAAGDGDLSSINTPVDLCNVVSLRSGLPISVVDADLTAGALRVGLGGEQASYVFNRSGQQIGVAGLLCLFDAAGPCANAVKDAQRTKTHEGTTRTLSLVWGSSELPAGHLADTLRWYRELCERAGARTCDVELASA